MGRDLKYVGDTVSRALQAVQQKFVDADVAYTEKARELGLNDIEALITLISVHRVGADQMELELMDVVRSITGAPSPVADEEEE